MALPCIIIPAYMPDEKMIELIKELQDAKAAQIIVVDDGSGEAFTGLFQQAADLGCTLLRHDVNKGKGQAIKTALSYGLTNGLLNDGVITADADGQHTPPDIQKIADAMVLTPEAMVLGVRNFTGEVPLKSRLGNGFTRFFFALIHGSMVKDTQTGLRGLPLAQIPLLISLPGERYEYEMNMLLALRPHGIKLVQIPIDTIYIEGNRSSHYRAFQDSMRIFWLLLKYAASSMASFVVEYGVFALMHTFVADQLIGSVVVARAVSSLVNFSLNKHVVFKHTSNSKATFFKYYALVLFNVLASYLLIKLFTEALGFNVYVGKVIADSLLMMVSYVVQRDFVYRRK